ncbi:hypothetical protein [Schlegelella aquatica]|uniref:hypothetical protein n=1 Tax=Caldimonas aquatica TaxID=376175 RepID=UPI003750F161
MPRFLAVILALLAALCALPAIGETHATDEAVQFLSNPKLTPQQKALLREIALDSNFDSKVASFAGLTPMRFANIETETQACLAAQYILFQDIARSKPPTRVLQFAQQNLKRVDWCSPVVRALTNQTVRQVLAYDGLVSLYYVLSRDMELRLKVLAKYDTED